ncbi:MAG: ABC transporter permease [Methanophagales archaeon]|nr:ABC transporter permease [Methanophagales archaeon]
MKFVSIATKGIKETVRDRKGLAMLLVFPMAFMLVFGFAFGGTEGENTPHEIAVLNYDTSTVLYHNNTTEQMNFGNNFTQLLKELKYEDSDVHLFHLNNVSEERAEDMLSDRDIVCIVIIPANFSNAMRAVINDTVRTEITSNIGEMMVGMNVTGWNATTGTYYFDIENNTLYLDGEPVNTTSFGFESYPANYRLPVVENITAELIIKGDTGYIGFGMAQSILSGILEQYENEVRSKAKEEVSGYFDAAEQIPNDFVYRKVKGIAGTESFTTFDYQAPGIIVFALLLLVVGVAGTLAGEVEHGTLERLKITKMKSFDLLFGTLIPWALIAIAQVFILFLVAIAMGYHWQGGITNIALAIAIGIIGGISSISLGLLVAAFSRSEKHAENLGMLVAVPMSFLVGAFFTLPRAVIGDFWGKTFQAYDVLPWTHTVNALRSVLTFGSGLGDVVYDITMMIILTVILFVLGVICFSKTRLRAEE